MFNVNDHEYKVIKNYRDAFNESEVIDKITDYYNDYDYIVGDIAYNKLRLKGFYKENNKKVKELNNIKNLDNYLRDFCAPDCKYFVLEKISK